MNVFLVQHKIMPDGENDFPPALRMVATAMVGIFSTKYAAELADRSVCSTAVNPEGFFRVSEVSEVTVDEFHPTL